MKVILEIKIYSFENQNGLTYTKEYETTLVPRIGEKVKDTMFVEDKLVIDVIHDLPSGKCNVVLVSKEVPDDRLDGHIQEVTNLHNWKLKL